MEVKNVMNKSLKLEAIQQKKIKEYNLLNLQNSGQEAVVYRT
jgi:hypothetical protein